MKALNYLIGIILFYFVYGFFISQFDFEMNAHKMKAENPEGYYDYRGATNVHTDLSEGSSDPVEVIADAKKAGLDFLILTDVNLLKKPNGLEGYYGNLLALVESESTFSDMRLLNYSGVKNTLPENLDDARMFFTDQLSQTDVSQRDNIVVLAHPFNNGPTWTGELPSGIDGIEILNPKSISNRAWVNSKLNVLWSLVCYPFNPNLAFLRLFQEPSDETNLWDKILTHRKLFGYSGADASARAFPFASYLVKFPSYEKSFEITANHLLLQSELTGNSTTDREKIFHAFKNGQFYFSLDLLGDPKGFVAYVSDKIGQHQIGSTMKLNRHLRLVAKLPYTPKEFYEIVVFKNGERDLTANQPEINYEIKSAGVYRVAVRVSTFLPLPDGKKWATWIYTNPFFVD